MSQAMTAKRMWRDYRDSALSYYTSLPLPIRIVRGIILCLFINIINNMYNRSQKSIIMVYSGSLYQQLSPLQATTPHHYSQSLPPETLLPV
jgi:hypothetical protein